MVVILIEACISDELRQRDCVNNTNKSVRSSVGNNILPLGKIGQRELFSTVMVRL